MARACSYAGVCMSAARRNPQDEVRAVSRPIVPTLPAGSDRAVRELQLGRCDLAQRREAARIEPLAGPVPMDRHDVASGYVVDEPGAVDPAADSFDLRRTESEASIEHGQAHRGDDERVTIALQHPTPADPARVHDLEGTINVARPQHAHAWEHVDALEGMVRTGAGLGLGSQPAPAVIAHSTSKSKVQVLAE